MTGKLGKRYIQPLFEVARDKGVVEQVGRDLSRLSKALADNSELKKLLLNPSALRSDKKKVLNAMFDDFSRYSLNFLSLVIDKNRSDILLYSSRIFSDLVNSYYGILTGVIESAKPLQESEIDSVKGILNQRFGGTIQLEQVVDPNLIAGTRIRLGNCVLDGSIRGRLNRLKMVLGGK